MSTPSTASLVREGDVIALRNRKDPNATMWVQKVISIGSLYRPRVLLIGQVLDVNVAGSMLPDYVDLAIDDDVMILERMEQ